MTKPNTGTIWWLPRILHCDQLSPTETLVMIVLADHVNTNDQAFPSAETLGRGARCHASTVRRHLGELERRGFIRREERRRADGGRSTDLITLLRPAVDPPMQIDGGPYANRVGPLRASDKGPYAPGARAEVPNEVPNELDGGAEKRAEGTWPYDELTFGEPHERADKDAVDDAIGKGRDALRRRKGQRTA